MKSKTSQEFVHIPKSVFDEAIIEMLGSAAFIARLGSVNGMDVFTHDLVPIAFGLLGYDWDEVPSKLTHRIIEHIFFVVRKIKPFEEVYPEKMGKMIFKLWKTELEMYQQNPKYYE